MCHTHVGFHVTNRQSDWCMSWGSCPERQASAVVYVQECHCMLFLTEDNDFAGKDQDITLDEIKESTS